MEIINFEERAHEMSREALRAQERKTEEQEAQEDYNGMLEDVFGMLAAAGLDPLLCDTSLPYYDTTVMCGEPTTAYEYMPEKFLLPKELVSMNSEFIVKATGSSMIDAKIEEGDRLKIMTGVACHDGDIVLASIDGEVTVKAYCADEEGQVWLVPQNSDYKPIKLNRERDNRIIGKVVSIIKDSPRVSFRDCMRRIREASIEQEAPKAISQEQISLSIRAIACEIEVARLWYAVYRAMVDKNVLEVEAFETFCTMVASEVAEHEHLPSVTEMQRLAVQSFRKPIAKWDPTDAPVKGKRFNTYKAIGLKMIGLLEA